MKKILGILLAVLFLTAGNALAHCGKCGMGDDSGADLKTMAEEKAGKMAKDLSLSDDQKNKVTAILINKMQRKHSLMEAKDKAMDDISKEYEAKLKEVLSEEQLKKWEKNKGRNFGHCPMCKDGEMCEKCKGMKGKHGKCPECKDGKACVKCAKMGKGDCPKCKDGKMCAKCGKMNEGKCPMCKDGKLCKKCQKCQKNKENKDDAGHEGHDHTKEGNKGYLNR